jgi:hypothetical protein
VNQNAGPPDRGASARTRHKEGLIMNLQETSEIRDLSADDLDQVNGGFGALLAIGGGPLVGVIRNLVACAASAALGLINPNCPE